MQPDTDMESFAILDFEASSLSRESWPIEVGLSWLKNGEVQTWSTLIRPAPDWDLADWAPQSAAVHGIALEDLQEAPVAWTVVDDLLANLGDRVPVSDAPEFEARWLFRLMKVGGRSTMPAVEDYHRIGAISVYLEGAWHVVPSVYDRFVGMHFHDWMKVRRALRAKSASRKAWNQEIVFNAIDRIEDLVKDRSMAFGIIDTTISDAQFKKIEEDFFSSFRIDDTPRLKADGQDLGRVITPRAPDPDIAPTGAKASVKAAVVKPSHDVQQREETAGTVHTPSKGRATAPKFGLPPKREG